MFLRLSLRWTLPRKQGLDLPVVYNSRGYEKCGDIENCWKDMWMYICRTINMHRVNWPDSIFLMQHDYPEKALQAISEMVRQTGTTVFNEEWIYSERYYCPASDTAGTYQKFHRGTEIFCIETFGNRIYISIMNQYTPVFEQEKYTELNRMGDRKGI